MEVAPRHPWVLPVGFLPPSACFRAPVCSTGHGDLLSCSCDGARLEQAGNREPGRSFWLPQQPSRALCARSGPPELKHCSQSDRSLAWILEAKAPQTGPFTAPIAEVILVLCECHWARGAPAGCSCVWQERRLLEVP